MRGRRGVFTGRQAIFAKPPKMLCQDEKEKENSLGERVGKVLHHFYTE